MVGWQFKSRRVHLNEGPCVPESDQFRPCGGYAPFPCQARGIIWRFHRRWDATWHYWFSPAGHNRHLRTRLDTGLDTVCWRRFVNTCFYFSRNGLTTFLFKTWLISGSLLRWSHKIFQFSIHWTIPYHTLYISKFHAFPTLTFNPFTLLGSFYTR